LAAVYGPREIDSHVSKSKTLSSGGSGAAGGKSCLSLAVYYKEATFSTGGWKKTQRNNRRVAEINQALRKTFESVILTHLYPNSQIEIFLQLLQNDGSTFAACINATTLALVDAGIPMRDYLVSCTAGYIDGTALIDINQTESNADGPELPVAMLSRTSQITLLQMDSKIGLNLFEEVLDAAISGCAQVFKIIDEGIRKHANKLIECRGIVYNR
jgi:exosome complex component RRP41